MEMEKTLKNILLAGLGTAAMAYDKAMETVEEMVQKGELTLEQGKDLSAELKSNLMDKDVISPNTSLDNSLSEVITQGNIATKKDIEELQRRIEALESQN